MRQIFESVGAGKIGKLLQQYSDTFRVKVLLFDKSKRLLFKFPEDASQSDLIIKPLYLRDSIIGYAAIQPADDASQPILDFIVQNMSGIIEMGYEIESLSGEVANNYEELSLLWKLSSRLGAGLNMDEICHVLAEEVMGLCPSNNVSIFIAGGAQPDMSLNNTHDSRSATPVKRAVLFPKVSLGAYADKASAMTLSTDWGLVRDVFGKMEPITICGADNDERFKELPYPVKYLLIVPLVMENTVTGVIIATDKLSGEEFYSTEMKLIFSIASECAVSIKKALLFDEIRTMLFSTAEAFSFAIEAKDPYTYGHSKRVSEITVNIAIEIGLPSNTINWIKLAALLHDIGKIGTPERILNKNGKLDAEEIFMMMQHTSSGARMVENIPRFKEISRWIAHHHEKYDGSGYPAGLKGDDIPLPSRILSIADCFDALTSDRPYRKMFNKDEAVRIMREAAGTQFDPILFDCFEQKVAPLH